MNTEGWSNAKRGALAEELLRRALDDLQSAQNTIELAAQALCSATGVLAPQWGHVGKLVSETKSHWHRVNNRRGLIQRLATDEATSCLRKGKP